MSESVIGNYIHVLFFDSVSSNTAIKIIGYRIKNLQPMTDRDDDKFKNARVD